MDRRSNSYFDGLGSVPFRSPRLYMIRQEEYTPGNQKQDYEREDIEFWNTRFGFQGIMFQDLQDDYLRDSDSRPFERTVNRTDGTVEVERTGKTVGGKPEARRTLRKITLRLEFSGCAHRQKSIYAECKLDKETRSKTLEDLARKMMELIADYLLDDGLVLGHEDGRLQAVTVDDIVLMGARTVSPGSFQPIVACWVF